jgi:hypothetical protein
MAIGTKTEVGTQFDAYVATIAKQINDSALGSNRGAMTCTWTLDATIPAEKAMLDVFAGWQLLIDNAIAKRDSIKDQQSPEYGVAAKAVYSAMESLKESYRGQFGLEMVKGKPHFSVQSYLAALSKACATLMAKWTDDGLSITVKNDNVFTVSEDGQVSQAFEYVIKRYGLRDAGKRHVPDNAAVKAEKEKLAIAKAMADANS